MGGKIFAVHETGRRSSWRKWWRPGTDRYHGACSNDSHRCRKGYGQGRGEEGDSSHRCREGCEEEWGEEGKTRSSWRHWWRHGTSEREHGACSTDSHRCRKGFEEE